jgi:xanthine dehydrogenase YagR molybdenum-binding subunit
MPVRFGAKGIGELGATGVAAAVANAVFDAIGLRVRDLPITPSKLLGA